VRVRAVQAESRKTAPLSAILRKLASARVTHPTRVMHMCAQSQNPDRPSLLPLAALALASFGIGTAGLSARARPS